MQIVEKMEQIKTLCRVSYKLLFEITGICSATFRRWKSRIENALDPVFQPGPTPVSPLDLRELHNEMRKLEHNAKRTRGVGLLRKSLQGSVSRRDLNLLIADARRQEIHRKKASLCKVDWHEPGTVWAMDVFEIKYHSSVKFFVLTVQDLASGYKFPPLATKKEPHGKEVADHLQKLFARYGSPLFLKLDNGGNLNHSSVMDLLADNLVLPINSPAYYAPYNGAIEHTQREFKERLLEYGNRASSFKEFALLVDIVAHELNHLTRRKLKGQNSCLRFFGNNKIFYSKRKRKEVFEWVSELAIDIMEKSGKKEIMPTAWRVACRKWLEKNGLVSIRKSQKVLPYFLENFTHN